MTGAVSTIVDIDAGAFLPYLNGGLFFKESAMAVMHSAHHCPRCGGLVPRRNHPNDPLGPKYGDNSYLDLAGHEKVCSGKRKTSKTSGGRGSALPLVADVADVATSVIDTGGMASSIADAASGAAEVAGEVCSAIVEIAGDCL